MTSSSALPGTVGVVVPSWQAGASGHIQLVAVPDPRIVPEALDALLVALPDGERELCARWAPRRQATFAAGRQALRLGLASLGLHVDGVVGRDDRGAPVLPAGLPDGLRVSLTHKDSVAGALVVSGVADDVTVGVDLELDDGRARDATDALARQVLLPHELATLPDDDAARRRALFECFSLKEALYKALDPFLRRYIGFTEVEVATQADHAVFGGAFFAHDGVLRAEGVVVRVPALPAVVLTTAWVRRRRAP